MNLLFGSITASDIQPGAWLLSKRGQLRNVIRCGELEPIKDDKLKVNYTAVQYRPTDQTGVFIPKVTPGETPMLAEVFSIMKLTGTDSFGSEEWDVVKPSQLKVVLDLRA